MHSHSTRGRRVGILIGLCALYACIHLDRQILGILAQSVKADLQLSDRQLGALTGSAFSIVYAVLGLHFGRLADRTSRLRLIRIGAWVWSLSSIAAAFAPGYGVLVATRAGVAAGEAIATAAAVSLMSEVAGERRRAAIASVFFSAAFFGAGVAAIGGGAMVAAFRGMFGDGAWRAVMAAAGLPGIVGALYLSRFQWEGASERHESGHRQQGSDRRITAALLVTACVAVVVQVRWPPALAVPLALALGLGIAAVWVAQMRRIDPDAYEVTFGEARFRRMLVGFAALLFVDFAAGFWLIPLAQRRYGLSPGTVGAQLGALLIGGGIAGALLGGWIADRWQTRSRAGHVWTALIAVILEVAAILSALHQPQFSGYVLAFGAMCLASGAWTGVAAAIAFDIVPPAHRGTGAAGYFLVTTLLGPGLGPFAVGVVSDMTGSTRNALGLATAVAAIAVLSLVRLGMTIAPSRLPRTAVG